MLKKTLSGVCAGILISIGGTVFLSCDNKYIGAVLFSVALLSICIKGYSLFTGKIGFIPESHKKKDFSVLLLGLLGNFAATLIGGEAIRFALPGLQNTAYTMCDAKLYLSVPQVLIRAMFCGILMYLAVCIYRDKKSVIGILFGIPVFILCGFEHSIADMFYFAVSGIVSLKAFIFLMLVIIGNAAGGMLLPVLERLGKEEHENG